MLRSSDIFRFSDHMPAHKLIKTHITWKTLVAAGDIIIWCLDSFEVSRTPWRLVFISRASPCMLLYSIDNMCLSNYLGFDPFPKTMGFLSSLENNMYSCLLYVIRAVQKAKGRNFPTALVDEEISGVYTCLCLSLYIYIYICLCPALIIALMQLCALTAGSQNSDMCVVLNTFGEKCNFFFFFFKKHIMMWTFQTVGPLERSSTVI